MKIIKSYITKNDRYKQNIKMSVKGLMLHDVGCSQPSGQVFVNLWNKTNVTVAVHGVIEKGGNVFQCLPWNIKGWHSGAGKKSLSANNNYIGVEMTIPKSIQYTSSCTYKITNKEDAKSHVLSTYNTAVELFAHLCKLYNLNPTGKNDLGYPTIISHEEGHKLGIASNHGDPYSTWKSFGLTMDQFRKDVKAKMSGGSTSSGSSSSDGVWKNGDYNCKVRATANLNLRTGRGTDHSVVYTIPKGTVFEVGYVKDNWGSTWDFKGKVGYFCCKYVEKV